MQRTNVYSGRRWPAPAPAVRRSSSRHRLSTIRNADRTIVLEKGRVVEAGPHDSLLAAGGIYADLIAFQRRTISM